MYEVGSWARTVWHFATSSRKGKNYNFLAEEHYSLTCIISTLAQKGYFYLSFYYTCIIYTCKTSKMVGLLKNWTSRDTHPGPIFAKQDHKIPFKYSTAHTHMNFLLAVIHQ